MVASRSGPGPTEHSAPARCELLLVGVGGQGVLTAAQILGTAAHAAGLPVVVGQLHGMSQRGGSVECTVRFGAQARSAHLPRAPDVLVAFEPIEALRALRRVGKHTVVLVNRGTVAPLPVQQGKAAYPERDPSLAALGAAARRVLLFDGPTLVREVGVPRTLNVMLLGAVTGLGALPLAAEALWSSVAERLPQRFHEANRRAFELGLNWAAEQGEAGEERG